MNAVLQEQPLYIGGCFAGVELGRQLYDAFLAPCVGGGGSSTRRRVDEGRLAAIRTVGSLGQE